MKKLTFFLLRVINKLFIKKLKGNPDDQEIFDYLQNIVHEGKSYGLAGDIIVSGELHSIRAFNNHFIGEKAIIFDVGANKGQYQKELADHLNMAEFIIHSFEPSPSTFKTLEKNANKNCVNHNIGFGNTKEKLKLFRTGEGSPLSSLHQKTEGDYYNVEMNEFEEVNIETIDNFCLEQKIEHIDFLKLDIEGHELFALQGAKNMISNNKINFIQFEFGPPNIDSRTYLRDIILLLQEQYDCYRVLNGGLFKFEYKETDEIFLPINYFAMRKGIIA